MRLRGCSATEREHLLRESERCPPDVDAAVDVRLLHFEERGRTDGRFELKVVRMLTASKLREASSRLCRCRFLQVSTSTHFQHFPRSTSFARVIQFWIPLHRSKLKML